MAYTDRFQPLDEYIGTFDNFVNTVDPLLVSRQAGFICISAVTVFELAIKDIFVEFAQNKDSAFGHYVAKKTDKLNGQITLDRVKNYVGDFGESYNSKFASILEADELENLNNSLGSIKASYGSIISIRHALVHRGEVQISYFEAKNNYANGKKLLDCLYKSFL